MEWIAAMQQAITYMEEHLLEEINEDGDCIGDTWSKFYKEFLP